MVEHDSGYTIDGRGCITELPTLLGPAEVGSVMLKLELDEATLTRVDGLIT
jgi:hypothetical protein